MRTKNRRPMSQISEKPTKLVTTCRYLVCSHSRAGPHNKLLDLSSSSRTPKPQLTILHYKRLLDAGFLDGHSLPWVPAMHGKSAAPCTCDSLWHQNTARILVHSGGISLAASVCMAGGNLHAIWSDASVRELQYCFSQGNA